MMSHVSFGTIQQSFKLQSVGISVCNNVANLPNYSGENEHANQVTDYCEHVPVGKAFNSVEQCTRFD
jgi:glutaminase